jgi:predicted RNase H-like nuclease
MTSSYNLYEGNSAWIVGIDLAWKDHNQDGLCLIHATRDSAKVIKTATTKGDDALLAWLQKHLPVQDHVLLAIDAPLIVPNATGSRPVDKQITFDFGKYHAGCYPANSKLCERPPRLAQRLRDNGYLVGYDLKTASRMATEVYPHPAMIRLFNLDRIIKYKKGTVAAKNPEFRRLQNLLRKSLNDHLGNNGVSQEIEAFLIANRSKTVEDQTDAIFCALIGYLHWKHHGHLSKVIGSIDEGFILLPPKYRNGFALMEAGPTGPIVTMELVNKLRDED